MAVPLRSGGKPSDDLYRGGPMPSDPGNFQRQDVREFVWPIRVYYEDTDSGGVVYHANYLKFMERARSEWLRTLGFEQDALLAREGLLFAVRSVALDYLRPARFNDTIEVVTTVKSFRKASLEFQQIVRGGAQGAETPLCAGVVKIACVDAGSFRPRPIPEALIREITFEY
jgi:acyl-CoA thioester hydrolase